MPVADEYLGNHHSRFVFQLDSLLFFIHLSALPMSPSHLSLHSPYSFARRLFSLPRLFFLPDIRSFSRTP